jgi:acetyl-CoA acetyltransferase
MIDSVISGIGEVSPSRRLNLPASALVLRSIKDALADAGIEAADIEAVVTESSVTPVLAPIADIAAAAQLGNLRMSAMTSPVAAGIFQAIGMADLMVSTGAAKHVLVYYGLDWGTKPLGPSAYHEAMLAKSFIENPPGFAGPPLYFAVIAKRYANLYGISDDELEVALSEIVLANRFNAAAHPEAQAREPMDLATYRKSPMIAEPLRKADCALLSDGAIAVIVSARKSIDTTRHVGVRISSWAWAQDSVSDSSFYSQSELPLLKAAAIAGPDALRRSGMSTNDIDFVEVYDCFSIATLLQLESLGFCSPGSGPSYVSGGSLRFNGSHPTNTHGGLLSHGYVMGANHFIEAVRQLRRDAGERQVADASTAMVGAGPGRQYTALVLRRDDD